MNRQKSWARDEWISTWPNSLVRNAYGTGRATHIQYSRPTVMIRWWSVVMIRDARKIVTIGAQFIFLLYCSPVFSSFLIAHKSSLSSRRLPWKMWKTHFSNCHYLIAVQSHFNACGTFSFGCRALSNLSHSLLLLLLLLFLLIGRHLE